MDNPRPEKVAVIDEVRARLDGSQATVVTEYRGLTVADLAALRKSLTAAGGDYKVFKNTLVKRAIGGGAHAPLEELLAGPTAIAFVHGDVSAVAKALRDFARTNTHLVVKGGMLDGGLLSTAQLAALADLPSRDVLLARIAGGFQAPMAQLASLLQALPRNLAYGLKALVDERGGAPAEEGAPAADEAPATDEPEVSSPQEEASVAPETVEDAPSDAADAVAPAPPEAAETAEESPSEAPEADVSAPAEAADDAEAATEAPASGAAAPESAGAQGEPEAEADASTTAGEVPPQADGE